MKRKGNMEVLSKGTEWGAINRFFDETIVENSYEALQISVENRWDIKLPEKAKLKYKNTDTDGMKHYLARASYNFFIESRDIYDDVIWSLKSINSEEGDLIFYDVSYTTNITGKTYEELCKVAKSKMGIELPDARYLKRGNHNGYAYFDV